MSKGAKIVCNIIYYVAAFLIGLFLAVALPSIMIYNDSLAEVRNSLESGNYNQAMMHIGGYFDSEYIYLDTTSDNADVVIFNALTLVYNSGEEDDETKDETKVHKAYCGYLFNMRKDYQTAGKLETNQAALLIYDKDNVSHKYQLLDYDSNNDGEVDSVATQSSYDFIFFEIPYEETATVSKLEFISQDGSVYKTITFDNYLRFEENFFQDVNSFMEEYNRDYQSSSLEELDKELRTNPHYIMSSNGDVVKKVNRRVVTIIIIYFLAIYLIGDSLFGFRFVIRGIKWIIRKASKKDLEDPVVVQEVMEDIHCMLTIKLELLDDFDKEVTICYANSKEEIVLTLDKENGFVATKRVVAGIYTLQRIDIDDDYEVVSPLDKLVLTSFSEETVIKIKKKQENRDEN